MADHIPFITGPDVGGLVKRVYPDCEVARIPLGRAQQLRRFVPAGAKLWLDPCVDGMHDLESRRSTKKRPNAWFDFMSGFPKLEKVGSSPYDAKKGEVREFVEAVMDKCAEHSPAWITVPQLPLVEGSCRNRINRELAKATGEWKNNRRFVGRLILPLVLTHQRQIRGRTERRPKLAQAERCYQEAEAEGLWVVESSLDDEKGSSTLRKRLSSVIALHEELNDRIPSGIRIAGPYWGLNLVLWARNLVDYPAIGIGTGYRYLLAGGPAHQASAKLALASLRRRGGVGEQLDGWLDSVIRRLDPSHPARAEFRGIRKSGAALRDKARAREQVAKFYKEWFDAVAAVPKAGRSLALFQDLSAAFAFGKSLPDLPEEGPARKPEAVAEPLMLNCL